MWDRKKRSLDRPARRKALRAVRKARQRATVKAQA
jgi:hypothetical protein